MVREQSPARMRRPLGVLLSAIASLLMAGCAGTSVETAPRPTAAAAKPNVLLILVDDLKPALGAYGDRTAISPNIDALAARGVRFDNAFANQAVCAPSRLNLMMGARSTSTGLYHFGMNLRDHFPTAVTLPQHFMAAGYHAESMGKVYHIGHGSENDAASWSVPHHKDRVIEYVLPASAPEGVTREEALFQEKPYEGKPLELPRGAAWERPSVADTAYADGRTAKRAVERLTALKERGEPFFLTIGFARPHLPFSVPKRYWDLYDPARLPMPQFERLPADAPEFAGKLGGEIDNYFPVPPKTTGDQYPRELTRTLVHGYYAGVSYVDAQIGKVMAALDRLGIADNTIVVLWGDHGFHLGDHGMWTKHTNYEQAVRIPLIFAGPGVGRGGRSTGQPAETVDIYPTLAALAGLAVPPGPQPIDGINLTPVLADTAARLRPYAYHSFPRVGRIGQAIRTERYRLVRWTQEASGEVVDELYDLQSDPLETRNIVASNPAVVRELGAYLAAEPAPVTVSLKDRREARQRP